MKEGAGKSRKSSVAPHLGATAIQALRPLQWLKNVLIAAPAIAAHSLALDTWLRLCLAIIAFNLSASAGYIVNDLLDREHDRKHPWKRHRPFAAGILTATSGVLLSTGMLAVALVISLSLPRSFLVVLCVYFALTVSYSFFLKQLIMVDVVVLACLYGLRVVAGGAAGNVPLSEWFIAFCVFFFLSLALVKRAAELRSFRKSGEPVAGRGYASEDLPVVLALAGAAGFISVLVLALYLDSEDVRALYSYPLALWGVGLILIFWIGRVVLITGRGQMHDDPVVFAVTDKISVLSVLAAGATLILSI